MRSGEGVWIWRGEFVVNLPFRFEVNWVVWGEVVWPHDQIAGDFLLQVL